jgi:hypothetical protein
MLFPRINTVSEILSYKVNKLLECDESIFICIKFIEDKDKIFSGRFESNEVAALCNKEDELFKGNLFS